MEDFCILMCTTMFCLLVIVIVCDALGIPSLLERGVTALEQIVVELRKQNEPIIDEICVPEIQKIGFITETEDK